MIYTRCCELSPSESQCPYRPPVTQQGARGSPYEIWLKVNCAIKHVVLASSTLLPANGRSSVLFCYLPRRTRRNGRDNTCWQRRCVTGFDRSDGIKRSPASITYVGMVARRKRWELGANWQWVPSSRADVSSSSQQSCVTLLF
ncbi:hypothetical protein J6590_008962 [Homalodisca vitripennis]|nr:hypothetical protein J6590_008962 [Homalodisca vitripennis]